MFHPETKILIVDDMSTMRKIVQKALKSCGFSNFVVAIDGSDAWVKLQEHQDISLIISDWNMPNLTGIELLKKVKADQQFSNTPFILLTAESEASQIQEALVSGVDNYIVKPFSASTLQNKLEVTYKKINAKISA